MLYQDKDGGANNARLQFREPNELWKPQTAVGEKDRCYSLLRCPQSHTCSDRGWVLTAVRGPNTERTISVHKRAASASAIPFYSCSIGEQEGKRAERGSTVRRERRWATKQDVALQELRASSPVKPALNHALEVSRLLPVDCYRKPASTTVSTTIFYSTGFSTT